MSKYLFIESRDPFTRRDAAQSWELACALAAKGKDVVFFLVQNGVLAARKGARSSTLVGAGSIKVFADDLSLSERGMAAGDLREGVTVDGIDKLLAFTLEAGRKPLWL